MTLSLSFSQPVVAAIREQKTSERRVAIDPSAVRRLAALGCSCLLQKGLGESAGFADSDYEGADFAEDASAVLSRADLWFSVGTPSAAAIQSWKSGGVLLGLLFPAENPELLPLLASRQASAFAMESMPRITRAQSMDALSSQATIAGYQAALLAAQLSPRLFPMLTTAASTIRPSTVVVIGAGVAGLQAIATSARLGARVEGYDIRPEAKEQIESLGARAIDVGIDARGEGGYARELTDEERARQAEVLKAHLIKADAVISTAAVPGRPAPRIIDAATVAEMKSGSVLVDAAAESGGNCELTKPGETIQFGDKTISGPLNLASSSPLHASEMYARNLTNLLGSITEEGRVSFDPEDEIVDACLLLASGEARGGQAARWLAAAAPTPPKKKAAAKKAMS